MAVPQSQRRPSQGELVEALLFQSERVPTHPLIDIGVNLVDHSFEKDRERVLDRAQRAGLQALVVTGSCLKTSAAAAALAERPSNPVSVYFTAGVHPHNAKNCDDSTIEELRRISAHEKCVAIGECGLDFNRNYSPPAVQLRWFNEHIRLANEINKPLFMHCRDAGPEFIQNLQANTPHRPIHGVLHCFTGNETELLSALNLGLYIGITGWVCDERPERGATALKALLPLIPDDKLVIETDAPYLTPRTLGSGRTRPSRNEPALLYEVLRVVAVARGQTEEAVAAFTVANSKALFCIS